MRCAIECLPGRPELRSAAMTAWCVVLATTCVACSSPNEKPEPAGEAMKTVAVAQAPQPQTAKKASLQIDRQLPDAGWERAADAALKVLKPWLDKETTFTRFVMKPMTAPDGSRIDYLIAYEAFSAKGSEFEASILITGDKVVDKGGQEAATRYLHVLGFPGHRIDRGLLLEVLQIFAVEPVRDWLSRPSQFGWSKVFDDEGARLGHDRGLVTYDKTGATFTLYRPRPAQIQEEHHLADRLVLRFDNAAVITISSAREQQDKTWKPIPVAP